ncbi:uncharacterized protein LOC120731440 isoform X2 [Simochromis diagramma]|nr:uncharacterized protein LOC120731440 isoform X2 [Simochromis diagramma]
MDKTFAHRRREVIEEMPFIAEFKSRWPALFKVPEINAEFTRITTVPLLSTFMSSLDQYSDQLMKILRKKGGETARRITAALSAISQSSRIEVKRECILKAVIIYLNENPENLIKEYMAFNVMEAEELKRMDLGVYKGRRSLQMKEHSLMTPLKMLASLSRDAPSCRIFTMWRAGVHFCLG